MKNGFVRRARKLSFAGTGVILLALTTTACDSAPAPLPTPVPTPSTAPSTGGLPAPQTATPPPSALTPEPAAVTPAPAKAGLPVPADQAVPVLGRPWGPHQHGYGTARPGLIDNGGDASGVVNDVHWRTWGGKVAIGSGTASFVRDGDALAQGVPKTATVEAWDLGTCDGKLMYRAVDWFFPGEGRKPTTHGHEDLCAGKFVKF